MIKIASRIDSQNQVSLPDEVRRYLNVGADEELFFVIDEEQRTVAVRPTEMTLEETIGSVPAIPGMSDDFDIEIEEAISDWVGAKMERLARQQR